MKLIKAKKNIESPKSKQVEAEKDLVVYVCPDDAEVHIRPTQMHIFRPLDQFNQTQDETHPRINSDNCEMITVDDADVPGDIVGSAYFYKNGAFEANMKHPMQIEKEKNKNAP